MTALTAGCADSSFSIENQSSVTLQEINLAPVNSLSWGHNLIAGDMLYPGETLHIEQIDCDVYDVRIRDHVGRECVLVDLDLCFDNAVWILDNAQLASCAF